MPISSTRRWPTRVLLAAAIALLVMMAGAASTRPATAQTAHGAIATRALADLGTWQGECWTWVRQVVADSTGKQMGFGYRSGYFDAGAVEVSVAEAREGDVIQIADDSNADPGAYYPGLHTVIILENLGGGVFNGIDSNQNWDGVVRLRSNYNPFAKAAVYGLDVHIYRFDGSAVEGAQGAGESPVAPAKPEGSLEARVTTDSGCLNLRSAPSLSGTVLNCLTQGSRVWVTGAAVEADGYSWVPVTTPAGSGWVAEMYITVDEPAAPVAPAVVVPTSTPEPVATAEPTRPSGPLPFRVGVAGVTAGE